jgi:pimeloyl-[acyl-carrier protein] methyl ester esterase
MTLFSRHQGVGPPLVMLHGWGMNAAVWEPLLPGLSEHFSVTVIEMPGHGASPVARDPGLAGWARECLAVAPQNAHWLGWSLGGQVALQAAIVAPERVNGLTLLASTPCFVQAPGWPAAMPTRMFEQFGDALGADSGATLMRFLGLQVKGAEHARQTLRLLREEIDKRPAASIAGLQQGLRLLADTDLRAELSQLACPSHWLFGARDTLVPAAVIGALPGLLPGASIDVIDGAGHAPFLSHPHECLTSLLNAAA